MPSNQIEKPNNKTMGKTSLILTQIIFRHGQRSPDTKFPYQGDPYAHEKYLPFGPCELTLTGRKQCYHLGQKLRGRYERLLGPEYYYGIVDAKTSQLSRTQTSLELVLAGLFPPTPSTQIHDQLNWQPVPFTSKPLKEDNLIGKVYANMSKSLESPDFRKSQNRSAIIKCVKEKLNWDIVNQMQCILLYDTIKTQIEFGLTAPEWSRDIFPEILLKEFQMFTGYNLSQKCFVISQIGEFIQVISRIMTEKANEVKNSLDENIPKMYLYSGHDANIAGLLAFFEKFDQTKWPNCVANFAIELHQIDEDFYVKMLYQDGPIIAENYNQNIDVVSLTLADSKETLIKLSDFTEYVQENIHKGSN